MIRMRVSKLVDVTVYHVFGLVGVPTADHQVDENVGVIGILFDNRQTLVKGERGKSSPDESNRTF